MKIGYSLSLCVRDIIEGKVQLEDVFCIQASTAARDERDWDRLVKQYSETYWRNSPAEAAAVVQALRDTHRVVQPRLENPSYFRSTAAGVWEDDCV